MEWECDRPIGPVPLHKKELTFMSGKIKFNKHYKDKNEINIKGKKLMCKKNATS